MAGKNKNERKVAAPVLVLRADSEFGLQALIALHHTHSVRISADDHKMIAAKVREFELYRDSVGEAPEQTPAEE